MKIAAKNSPFFLFFCSCNKENIPFWKIFSQRKYWDGKKYLPYAIQVETVELKRDIQTKVFDKKYRKVKEERPERALLFERYNNAVLRKKSLLVMVSFNYQLCVHAKKNIFFIS